MSGPLNLQLKSEIFYSSVNLAAGDSNSLMTPSNTWKINILSGFASTASFATQEIKYSQLGDSPKRGYEKHNLAVNAADWSFKNYIRPTGVYTPTSANSGLEGTSLTGNVKPVADWFLWQALVSNTPPTNSIDEQSVWFTGGKITANNIARSISVHPSTSNFAVPSTNHLYFKLDNVIYQITDAVVDSASLDAGIEEIATVNWSGFGTAMKELTGTSRDNAVSVFGGVLNDGSAVSANANTLDFYATSSYHPFSDMFVGSSVSKNSFIKNKLSVLEINHKPSLEEPNTKYLFSVTSLSFSYDNNISYLSRDELAIVNRPKKAITGIRSVYGSATVYLRGGASQSAALLSRLLASSKLTSADTTSANLIIGGGTVPYFMVSLGSVHFDIPTVSAEDIMSVNMSFYAQNNDITIISESIIDNIVVTLLTEEGFAVITEDSLEIIL